MKEAQEMTGVQEVEERENLGRRKNTVVGTIKAQEAKEAQGAQGAKEAEGTIRCQLSAVSYHL